MATSAVTPAAGAETGSGGLDLDLGGVLGEAFDSATETAAPAGAEAEIPGGEAGSGPAPTPVPVEDTPPGEGQTQSAQPSATPGEWPLSPDGNAYMIPKGEGAALKAAREYYSTVSNVFPDAQTAQAAAGQAHDSRVMSNDWLLGDDHSIQSWLNHWSGTGSQDPSVRWRCQQSMGKLATALPGFLQQANPQALQGLTQAIQSKSIENAYAKAAQTGTDADWQAAQELDYGITGQYKSEKPQVDPSAQARQSLEAQQKDFQSRQEVAYQRDLNDFNTKAVEGAKFGELYRRIDQTLKPLEGRYSPEVFQDLRLGIQRDVVGHFKSQAPEWWTEHQQAWSMLMQDFRQTWQQGQPGAGLQPRVQHFVSDFVAHAMKVLPAIAQKRISGTPAKPGPKQQAAAPQSGAPRPPAQAAPKGPQGPVSRDQFDQEWNDFWNGARRNAGM